MTDTETSTRPWLDEILPYLEKGRIGCVRPASRNIIPTETRKQPYTFGFKQSFTKPTEMLVDYHEAFDGYSRKAEIDQVLNRMVDASLDTGLSSAQYCVAIFGCSSLQARRGFSHVHPIIQNQGNLSITNCSYLFLDKKEVPPVTFTYHQNNGSLYPTRCYVDYEHSQKMPLEYTRIEIPRTTSSITQILFNSAKVMHYQDYSDDLHVWLLFDGVEFDGMMEPYDSELRINTHSR